MDIYDSILSSNYKLIDQIAQQIFGIVPDRGPIMAIIDREGNIWLSHQEEFGKLNINESFLRELCAKVDDGAEPVVTQIGEASITAAQLFTERSNCGYVIIILPQYSPESTLININLIETLLRQSVLIAELIEKNNLLDELRTKLYGIYSKSEAPSN